jgi:hypothetical protein
MRIISNVRIGKLGCILVVVVILAFIFLLSHSTTHFFNGVSHKFHHWFQKTVFDHNWEDIHCRRRFKNETHVDESWIKVISEQLNIKNGQAVFDSNTGCNEWLRGLRKKYPKLKIGGAHTDQYAVEYAKRVFNDTQKTFVTVLKETGKLEAVDSHTYNHAINYAGLREMPKNTQCNLVRELLRIIKPGGSIYLGHNMEESDCKVMEKYSQYVTLPGCYWSKCLQNRTDVSDMYYIRESDLYGAHRDIDSCYTAVFVHKKVIINRVKDGPGEVKAKYKEHPKKFYCTSKPTGNSIVDIAKEFIDKHTMGGIVHPRNLAGALLTYKNSKENKNNAKSTSDTIGPS